MAKTPRKKMAKAALRNPQLVAIATNKRELKRIRDGYAEVSRLSRAIVALRARVERELDQFADAIVDSRAAGAPLDDSLEGSHG